MATDVPPGLVLLQLRADDGFYVPVQAGTPPQSFECIVDMGSSDSFFLANTNPSCEEQVRAENGSLSSWCLYTFNPNASLTTFYYPSTFPEFESYYYNASGAFVADTINLAVEESTGVGAILSNMTFGLVEQSGFVLRTCLIGLGLQAGELSITTLENGMARPVYDNVPILIKKSGRINRVSYSVFLNRTATDNGFVLFGGLDHSNYRGNLSVVPLVDYATDTLLGKRLVGGPTDFQIALSGVSISKDGETVNISNGTRLPTNLAFGTPMSTLPSGIVNRIALVLGWYYAEDYGVYISPCNRTADIIFNFSGAEIVVSLDHFLEETDFNMADGSQACAVLIAPQDDPLWSFGDSLFRAAYIYADLESFEIAFAQAVYARDDESDFEIVPADGKVRDAVQAPYYNESGLSSDFNITSSNKTFYSVVQPKSAASGLVVPSSTMIILGLAVALL